MLAHLDTQRQGLIESLLRIAGALQVCQELLSAEAQETPGAVDVSIGVQDGIVAGAPS